MIVERIWTGNAYRNFNYLIACPETGEALAIDPLDYEKTLATAKVRGWQITQVLNTHEHHDHTGGNEAVIAATGAKLIAHYRAGGRIAGVDRGVQAGAVIKVGKTVELECLDTPGHTQVCPGHDYIENNLRFTLAREPDNAAAAALLPTVTDHDPANSVVTTLKDEKLINTFFLQGSPSVIARLRESFPDLPDQPDARMVFTKLRELRDKW